jgi:hypothetical protein
MAMAEEWSPQPEKNQQEETPSQRERGREKTLQAQPSEEEKTVIRR